jgi:16S rRNA (adenine(1408)-N(1))-methyltransferase
VVVDLGTGDGRSVLSRAAAEPGTLVFGIDATAGSMAEASRRATRSGLTNAAFLATGAEALSSVPWLAGIADRVSVTFPWGSLLRGVLGLDDGAILCSVAAVLRPGGEIEVLTSVIPSDGIVGFTALDDAFEATIREAWARAGLVLTGMCPATPDDVLASRSSWGRRLGAGHAVRPVWRLVGVRPDDAMR